MDYSCKVSNLESLKTVSVRTRCSVADLPDTIGKVYGQIMTHLASVGKNPVGAPFVGYFNMDMDDLDVEIGFPIGEDIQETNEIKMSSIPAGKFAETFHVGPYDQLKDAYTVLMAWMSEKGYQSTGAAYEFYLNDPGEEKPEDLETRILFQLL